MKRWLFFLLLPLGLIVLTGCPIPALYIIHDPAPSGKGTFAIDSCTFSIRSAHPWRDTKKKAIILFTRIQNHATTPRTFICSNLHITSQFDRYALNFTNKDLVNEFIMPQDTLSLQAGEQKELNVFFLSEQDYTRRSYNKSIESDTLWLSLKGLPKTIGLIGKRN